MAIITVTSSANSGVGSLRAAIAKALSGDTIQFSSTLANKQITLTGGGITINKNLNIDGSKAANLAISGNNASRIFLIEQYKKVNIKNLRFINGRAVGADGVGEGGAIQIREYGSLTVQNSTFRGNKASRGGAIRLGYGGSLTVNNSTFDSNDGSLANDGFSAGAIATFGAGGSTGTGKLVITNSQFINNRGVVGGAVYNLLGPVTITNSVFKNNVSTREGGAIFTDGASGSESDAIGGQILIQGSRFEGNKSVAGGGALYLWTYRGDQVIIKKSTIIGNSVTRGGQFNLGRGGGIEFAGSTLTIENTTIANNTSPVQGGGVWVNDNAAAVNITNTTISGNKAMEDTGGGLLLNTSDRVPVRITNSTIANNLAVRDAGGIWTGGSNSDDVRVTNTLFVGNTATVTKQGHSNFTLADGGGNIVQIIPGGSGPKVTANSRYVTDVKLGPLQQIGSALVHPLLTGSPAINSGVTAGAPTTDERGVTRDTRPDVGAFEFVATATTAPARLTRLPSLDGVTKSLSAASTQADIHQPGSSQTTLTSLSPVIDLRQVDLNQDGKRDRQTHLHFNKIRSTLSDSVIGYYTVTNLEGAVFDTDEHKLIYPEEAGYARAALRNRVTTIELQQNTRELTVPVQTGHLLAPYLITNGTAQDWLQEDASDREQHDLHAYFAYRGANPDQADHLKLLTKQRLGFEGAIGGGDRDFNDFVFKVSLKS
jgi:predicted outer membrane repeat protein